MSDSQRAQAETARGVGIRDEAFLAAYEAQKDVRGDKDAKGNTITLSASKKKKAAIDAATPELTQEQRQVLYEAFKVSEKVWNVDVSEYGGGGSAGLSGMDRLRVAAQGVASVPPGGTAGLSGMDRLRAAAQGVASVPPGGSAGLSGMDRLRAIAGEQDADNLSDIYLPRAGEETYLPRG